MKFGMATRRILREKRTIRIMISMYCSLHHSSDNVCASCGDLGVYATSRIDKCMFGNSKPVCSECKVHCFNQTYRKRIRQVIRFSGPKMILKHPYLAILHLINKHVQAVYSKPEESNCLTVER